MPAIADTSQSYSPRTNTQKIKDTFATVSLMKYFDPFMDWMYGIALCLAIFKDLLDMVSLGMFGLFTTFFISFVIWAIMFLTGSGMKKKMAKAVIKRYGTLIIGSLFEMLLGINILPVATLMVIVVFYLTLKERMLADKEEKMAAAPA